MHAKRCPSPLAIGGSARWRGMAWHGVVSVSKSLAGLLPAAGGAPHVAVLHPVHLTALLPLAAHLPAGQRHTERERKEQHHWGCPLFSRLVDVWFFFYYYYHYYSFGS